MLVNQSLHSLQLLIENHSNAIPLERLEQMAVRLEGYLWRRNGSDLASYQDLTTLKPRLKNLAMAMGTTAMPPLHHVVSGHSQSKETTL